MAGSYICHCWQTVTDHEHECRFCYIVSETLDNIDIILDGLEGIQEYIARDVNNIARVEDEGNIVSIEGNIFLYSPKKSHPILLLLLFIQGSVCHLTIVGDWRLPFCHRTKAKALWDVATVTKVGGA